MKKINFILITILLFNVSCKKKKAEGKALWIKEAFQTLESGNYPNIKAIAWWNENFKNNAFSKTKLRIDSSPQALSAYKTGVSSSSFITSPVFNGQKLLAGNGIYHSAYADFGGTEDIVTADAINNFESLAEKNLVWAYFSNNWMDKIEFPTEAVNTIKGTGKIPFIRMMPRSTWDENKSDPKYTLQKIIDGVFDTELNQWAIDAKATNIPLLIEFGTEVNGNWFPWNGEHNGGNVTNQFGDTNIADGPERFKAAYIHIIDLFDANNVTNVTWFFHFDSAGFPEESWNNFENYYPGDGYIDWIGMSIYGPQTNKEDNVSFKSKLSNVYTRISDVSNNPIAILEFGITEHK